MKLDKAPVFWQKMQTMRFSYLILTQFFLCCAVSSAEELYHAGAIYKPSWTTTIRSMRKEGYRINRKVPMVEEELRALNQHKNKRSPKVNALSRKVRHKDVLMHETALFFEGQFLKLEHTLVFPSQTKQRLMTLIEAIEKNTVGSRSLIYRAASKDQSAHWTYPIDEGELRITVLIDKMGSVLKLERLHAGGEATLEQYRRYLLSATGS